MSAVTVMIAGADKTYLVGTPLKASKQLGSIGTATVIIEAPPGETYHPNEQDEILIYLDDPFTGVYLFFAGRIDNYDEQYYEGGQGNYQLTLNCTSYAAMMTKLFIPVDQTFITAQLQFLFIAMSAYLATVGLTINYPGPIGGLTMDPTQTFNTPAAGDLLNTLMQTFGFAWCVDQNKVVQIFYPDDGYMAAPWSVTDANGMNAAHNPDWQTIKITRGGQYRNTQLATTTQQLMNTGNVLQAVASASDSGEVAAHGPIQAIVSVPNVRNLSQLQDICNLMLSQGVLHQVKLVMECTRDRLEPGQLLSFHTSIPPYIDSLLIQQVDSESQGIAEDGSLLFKHVATCGNSTFRLGAGTAWAQGIIDRANNLPIDRTSNTLTWTQAETIPGIANPGLATGTQTIILSAPKQAVAVGLTIVFNTGPTTTDCIFDILKNGSTIFTATPKPTVPAGQTELATGWSFLSNPLTVAAGDQFVVSVLQADPTAMDGVVALTLYG